MPKAAIVPDPTPNAFATGRSLSRAVVAVTEGLMRLMDLRELRASAAHEMRNVADRDTLIRDDRRGRCDGDHHPRQACCATGRDHRRVRADGDGDRSVAGGLATALLAPIGATLIQMGISRARDTRPTSTRRSWTATRSGRERAAQAAELRPADGRARRGGAAADQHAEPVDRQPAAGGGAVRCSRLTCRSRSASRGSERIAQATGAPDRRQRATRHGGAGERDQRAGDAGAPMRAP